MEQSAEDDSEGFRYVLGQRERSCSCFVMRRRGYLYMRPCWGSLTLGSLFFVCVSVCVCVCVCALIGVSILNWYPPNQTSHPLLSFWHSHFQCLIFFFCWHAAFCWRHVFSFSFH